MGVISHVKIIYQNDNSDTWNRQVTLVLSKICVRYNQGIDYVNQRVIIKRIVMARRTLFVTYFASYIIAISNSIRGIIDYYYFDCGGFLFLSITILISVYLVLLFAEPFFFRQKQGGVATIVVLKSMTNLGYFLQHHNIDHPLQGEDFWALMIFPLVVQAMNNFKPRIGYIFTGIFIAIMPYFLLSSLGLEKGLPLMFIYGSACFLVAAFIVIVRESVAAQDESQKQKAELQIAHQQLQDYTERAEELAVLQERNRLARELHDSVTQSLHSATLLAEAGQRQASSGDIEKAREYLKRLGEISQQALREMRLLVYELRPLALTGVGLLGALQQRLDAVERRSGVEVIFSSKDEIEIPEYIEEEFYRIAMEALNNALKHANPTSVTVILRKVEKLEVPCIELAIIDDGVGFDPGKKDSEEGFGLVSMRERIEKLGGELDIISAPGEGTQVIACLFQESPTNPNTQEG
jgi:signal transduction histidine kinase